jgi:hypothetical protein
VPKDVHPLGLVMVSVTKLVTALPVTLTEETARTRLQAGVAAVGFFIFIFSDFFDVEVNITVNLF